MQFFWHDEKSKANLTKHGVSFDEAKSVFSDEFARLEHDPDHSINEDRFVLLGVSSLLNLLVVIHIEIDEDIHRIISARKATKKEGLQYRRFKS